jgi:hypothetical protein
MIDADATWWNPVLEVHASLQLEKTTRDRGAVRVPPGLRPSISLAASRFPAYTLRRYEICTCNK